MKRKPRLSKGRKNIGHRGIKIKRSKAMQGTLNLVQVDRKGSAFISHILSVPFLGEAIEAISPSWKIIFRHIKYMRREVQSEN